MLSRLVDPVARTTSRRFPERAIGGHGEGLRLQHHNEFTDDESENCFAACRFGTPGAGKPGIMGYQVTEVQKCLSGFDYPGSADDLAQHAQQNGADDELVQTLRGLGKDSFDGPNAVMKALGDENALGGSTS
jgi:hypothetical protein